MGNVLVLKKLGLSTGDTELPNEQRFLADSYFKQLVVGKLSAIEEKLNELKEMRIDHERRLRKLERLAHILIGIWVILSGFLARHLMGGGK